MDIQRCMTRWKDLLTLVPKLKKAKARRMKELAAKVVAEAEEQAMRAELRWRWRHMLYEITGREAELARLLGAKTDPPYLKDLNDQRFKDFNATGHPYATVGLAVVFPATHAAFVSCVDSGESTECACYVRSMLVRGGVAHACVLNRCNPHHLRV